MTDTSSRPYRKRKRARKEAATRRRITEAAVDLHGTVGPAHTTVSEVAERAGVSRTTVYNHFPSEADLFRACSSHWATRNPFPDPADWKDVADPEARLRGALEELYSWYGRKEGMLGKVFRDVPTLPALSRVMDGLWSTYMDDVIDVLSRGWPDREAADALRAALRLAVDFHTWRRLTESGMDDAGAAEVVARMVTAVG
jgi:AcrR family transcriptional regulator